MILTGLGMTVGARQAALSISETLYLLGFSHTTVSRVYSDRNVLLIREVRKWPDWFGADRKASVTVFWQTFAPLIPMNLGLNVTAYLSVVADHGYDSPSSNGYFQHDYVPFESQRTVSNNLGNQCHEALPSITMVFLIKISLNVETCQ